MRNFFLAFLILATAHLTYAVEIKIPVTSDYGKRDTYKIDLLKFVLNKAGTKFKINLSQQKRSQARIVKDLKEGTNLNLYWMGTSAELEKELLPIYFPMYRGLVGHRIFIIHKNDQVKFDQVKTLSDLQKYTGIQGIGWADIKILEHSGLKQHKTVYENIFKMINFGGRKDYFSRAIIEAFGEIYVRKDQLPNLAVEKKVLLVYPFAMFFFTSPSNKELARALGDGFRKAYQDGSFNTFFYNHPEIKELFKKSNIENRIRITIPNPLLSTKTSSIPDKYWHGR